MRRLLFVDERVDRRDPIAHDLLAFGFDVTPTLDETQPPAAIVVAVDGTFAIGLPPCARSNAARNVPVVVAATEHGDEAQLQAAVDGAVGWVFGQPGAPAVAAAVEAALAPEAPDLAEQRRRARIAALEGLAGRSAEGTPGRVRLTRLERHRMPVSTDHAQPVSPLDACTPRQRELLDVVAKAGSVSGAAAMLGVSRSSVYAALRRIAHRTQLRDGADLLRMLGADERLPLMGS